MTRYGMLLSLLVLMASCSNSSSAPADTTAADTHQPDGQTADHVAADTLAPDAKEMVTPTDVVDLATSDTSADSADQKDGTVHPDVTLDQLADVADSSDAADAADAVQPSPCVEAGGSCTVPLPGMQMDGCFLNTAKQNLAGCPEAQICCVPIECYPQGGTYEAFENLCCEGLEPIPQCIKDDKGECMCPNCPCTVCSPCGNGVCDEPAENQCNCPQDCITDPLGECTDQGGTCKLACGAQEYSLGTKFCAESGPCCLPFVGNCAGPGESVGVYPGAPSCCPGLASLPNSVEVEGQCQPMLGAVTCSPCGNGVCNPEWENKCSCPEDCYLPEGECYGPYQPCANGSYCKYPNNSCGALGGTGKCAEIPMTCSNDYIPVCACDGKTYDNECIMEMAMMTKDHDGACLN